MPNLKFEGIDITSSNNYELETEKGSPKSKNLDNIAQQGSKSPLSKMTNLDSHCKICTHLVDSGKSVGCDICDGWVHLDCSEMTTQDWNYIKKHKKKTILKYVCPQCLDKKPRGNKSNEASNLDAKIENLTTMVTELAEHNRDFMKKMNEEEVKAPVWPKVEQKLQSSVAQVLENQKEKDEKLLNLILYNLPESKVIEAGKDNNKEDRKEVKDIFCFLNSDMPEAEVSQKILCVTRLGRRKEGDDVRPRPVKVELDSESFKIKTLKYARFLQEYHIPKIGISHDKTKQEMNEDRELKSKLMKTREDNPNGSFQIYDKRVMTRDEADKLKKQKADRYQERQRKAKSAISQKDVSEVKTPVTGKVPGSA